MEFNRQRTDYSGLMVVIVIGVSGSGKTVVGEALAARLGWEFEDADNWHPAANVEKMRSGHPLTDRDRLPWLASLNAGIREWLANGKHVVLACSALKARYRRALRAGVERQDAVRIVYLRGTYEEIDARMRQRRGHFMPESLLKSQFESFEEPEPSEALVIDVRLNVPEALEAIIAGLHLQPSEFRKASAP
jgi:gluconokinase